MKYLTLPEHDVTRFTMELPAADFVTTRQTNIQPSTDHIPLRFAIAATFTAEPLRPTIAFWGRRLQVDFDVRFAPYNQVLQTLIDPSSEFGTNTHGVNIVLVRLEDLGQFDARDPGAPAQLEANVAHLVEELQAAPARLSAPLIFCLCQSAPAFVADPERAMLKQRLAQAMVSALDQAPGLHCLHYDQIDALYPVGQKHDPEGDRLGKIPYTEAYYCALGTSLVRHSRALVRPPFKVIALDCDNTLWQGICGEDGPEGVILDPPRRALHEFMLEQRSAGMLLTLASKNNEEDVLETFRAHPEMPLQPNHFVTWRLNWESKGANLASIADQLSLGLDSFIFVDDNPKECAEVEEAIPEVTALALPVDIEETHHFLKHVWAFDHPVITAEDRKRSAYYEQVAEFGNEIRRAGSLEGFMASLDLRVTISPLTIDKIARVAQLTQRTNQFNMTAVRRTEAEIRALAAGGYECYTADVSDRFGDYGLVGVLIAEPLADELRVDTMLLSCRVLGRGVEHRLLAFAGQSAAARKIAAVTVPYAHTAKNAPALQFLESIGFGERRDTGIGFVLLLPSAQLAELEWRPPAENGGPAKRPVNREAQRRKRDYARIAVELSNVLQILEAMRRESRSAGADESMSDVERQLAGIWSDLLERPVIARTDNFFDLGGHSLLAVLLLLRIRESFGVELSIDDVYSGTLTLAGLAARIEAAQLGDIDPEDYAAMLAEIENMTDEEARELLARENPGPQA